MEMKDGLLLNGIDGQRGNLPIDQRMDGAALIGSSPAPSHLAVRDHASPLAGVAPDRPICQFLVEERLSFHGIGRGR
jgi:hypothetical protein